MIKYGANRRDQLAIKKLEKSGMNAVQISRELKIHKDTVVSFMEPVEETEQPDENPVKTDGETDFR